MKTLFGVTHLDQYLDQTINAIDDRHPAGIKSMMVELAPWMKHEDFPFFWNLAEHYRTAGTEIFHGDLNYPRTPQFIKRAAKGSSLSDIFVYVAYFIGASHLMYYDAIKLHHRDKGMMKAIEQFDPETVVVGRAHGDYVKRRMPHVHYVGIDSRELRTDRSGIIDPDLPDEVVLLKDYHPLLLI